MAISRILHMKSQKTYAGNHLKLGINYILKEEKTENGYYTGSINCRKDNAYKDMLETKRIYGKTDKRQGYHLIISFEENECDADTAFKIVQEFAQEYLASDYEVVYSVHTDTDHMHGHIIWNSVRFTDGLKYRYEKGDWERDIQPRVNKICEKYGLKTLDPTIRASEQKEWDTNESGVFVWNEQIKKDIDSCILRSADFQMFKQCLKELGYEIKYGKYMAIKPKGMQRFRRLKSLGEGYSEDEIKNRIEKESINSYKGRIYKNYSPKIRSYRGKVKSKKLTGLKKEYFRMLYRLGKIRKRSYSQVWKYKEDLRKFEQLKKQYLFLSTYEIESVDQIARVQEQIKVKRKTLNLAKKVIEKEMAEKADIIQAVEVIKEESKASLIYKLGDEFFKESDNKVKEAKEVLKNNGITFDEAKSLKEHYESLLKENAKNVKKLQSDIYVGNQIKKDIEKRIKEREIEALNKEKERTDQSEDKKKIRKR